jgi:hypothetical protein
MAAFGESREAIEAGQSRPLHPSWAKYNPTIVSNAGCVSPVLNCNL